MILFFNNESYKVHVYCYPSDTKNVKTIFYNFNTPKHQCAIKLLVSYWQRINVAMICKSCNDHMFRNSNAVRISHKMTNFAQFKISKHYKCCKE